MRARPKHGYAIADSRQRIPQLVARRHKELALCAIGLSQLLVHSPQCVLGQVEKTEDGQSGLEKVLSMRPDVVLVDVELPGLDGYALAQAVRTTIGRASVRLLAMTGHGQPEDQRRAVEAAFDAHLVKPVTLDQLFQVDRLEELAGHRRCDPWANPSTRATARKTC